VTVTVGIRTVLGHGRAGTRDERNAARAAARLCFGNVDYTIVVDDCGFEVRLNVNEWETDDVPAYETRPINRSWHATADAPSRKEK